MPADVMASDRRLVILDVNGVLLKDYFRRPEDLWKIKFPDGCEPRGVQVSRNKYCVVRPDAEDFIINLRKRCYVMLWSCSRIQNLMAIMNACFPRLMKKKDLFLGIYS